MITEANKPRFQLLTNLQEVNRNLKLIRREERTLKKIHKRMMKYTEERIQKLHKKHFGEDNKKVTESKRRKYNAKIKQLAKEFNLDYEAFLDIHRKLWSHLMDVVYLDEKEEHEDLEGLRQILTKMLSRPKDFQLPKKFLEGFTREYKKFVKDVEKLLDKDFRDDIRLLRHKHPRGNVFLRMMSPIRLAKKIRREDKKAMKEQASAEEFKHVLDEELRTGIRSDYMPIFIKYLHREGKLQYYLDMIRRHIKIIIYQLIQEHNKVTKSVHGFAMIVRNEPAFSHERIEEKERKLYDEEVRLVEDYLYRDMRSLKQLYKEAESDSKLFHEVEKMMRIGIDNYEKKMSEWGKRAA